MALVQAADGKSMAAAEQQPTLLRVVGSTLMIDERSVQFPTLYAAGAQEPWRQEIDEHVAAKRIQRIDCQYDTQVNETLTCESFIVDKNVTKEMMLPHTHHGVVAYALAAFLPQFTRVETLRVYTCAHEKLRETILTSAHVRCTIIRNDCLNGYWNTASLALFAKLRSGHLVERLHWNACVIAHTNSKDHFSAPEWALATMQFLNSNDDNDEDDEGDTRYHVTQPRVNANYVMHDFADVWSRTYFDCAYHVALAEYLDLHPVMLHDDGDQASHTRVMHEYGLPDESKFICATLAEDRWNIPRFGADAFTPYLANIHASLARTRILLGGERYAMAQLDNDVDFGLDDLHLREHYSVLLELRRLRFHATLTGQRPVHFSESNFETLMGFPAPQMPENEVQPPPPPVARGDNDDDDADDEMAIVPAAADLDEVPIVPAEDVDTDDEVAAAERARAAEEQKLTPYERQMRLHHFTVPGRLRLAMSNSNRMVDGLARCQYRVNQAVIADIRGDIPNIRRMMRESIRCNSLHIHVGYLNLDGYDTDGALLEILKNQSQLQSLKLHMHLNPFPAACRAAENALQRIFEILPDCVDLTSLSLINFPDSIVRKCLTQLLLPVEGRVLLPNLRSLFVSVVPEEVFPADAAAAAAAADRTRMQLSLVLTNLLTSRVPVPLSTFSYTVVHALHLVAPQQRADDADFLPQLLSACDQLRHLHIDIEYQPQHDCNELYAQVCRMANSLESLSFTGRMDEWHGGGQDVIANSFAATFLNSAQNLRSIAICFRRETSIDEVARAFIRRLQSNTNFDTLSFASQLNNHYLSDDVFQQLANELRGEWRNTRHHINFFTFLTYDNELTLREEERYDWLNHGMQPMRAGAGAASVWHESTSRVLMDMTLRNAPIRPTAMDEASDADWDTEPHAPGLMQHADRFEGRISRDALDECDKSRRRKRADGALIVDSVPLNVSWAPLHQSVGFQPPAAAAAAAVVDDPHCVFDRRGVVCHMLADDYDAAMSTFILDQLQRLEWMQQVALGMRDVGDDVVVPASPEVQLAATRVNWQGAYQVQAAHIIAEQLGAVPTAYRHGDRDAAIVPLWRPTLGCPSFGQFVDSVEESKVRGFPFPTARTIEQRETSRFQMLPITGVWGPVTSVLARDRHVHYMNGTVDLMGTRIVNEARPDEQHLRVYASSNQAPIRIHLPERISSEVRGFYAFDANADDMALLPFSAGSRCSLVCNIPCSQATTLVRNVVDPSESELLFGSSSPVRSGLI